MKGTVYRIRGETHPAVVISAIVDGQVLCVNFTDAKHFPDEPSYQIGEHSFIIKESCAAYWHAKCRPAAGIAYAIQNRAVESAELMRSDVLERLIAGARKSNIRGSWKRMLDM